MQAIVVRTGQVSRSVLVALVLLAGLILGGVGGYFIKDLSRTVLTTTSVSHSPTIAGSATSHAATERAAADSADALTLFRAGERAADMETAKADSAAALAQFRAGERAAANPSASSTP